MKFILTATAAVLIVGTATADPWPQGAANTDYQPATPDQTRAEAMDSGVTLKAEVLAEGLEHPWAVAILPDGSALITERPGRLKLYKDGTLTDVTGIPDVHQGDVAVIFGGGAADSVDDIADKCGTVNYEIICDIGRRVQRVYTRGGKPIHVTDYME